MTCINTYDPPHLLSIDGLNRVRVGAVLTAAFYMNTMRYLVPVTRADNVAWIDAGYNIDAPSSIPCGGCFRDEEFPDLPMAMQLTYER